MAGNKKNQRKSAGTRNQRPNTKVNNIAAAVHGAVNVTENLTQRISHLAKLHVGGINALNRIIDQTGNFSDWMQVTLRLYVGALVYDEYFEYDEDVSAMYNDANAMMHIIMIRTHTTGTFGVGVFEKDHIVNALNLTNELSRFITSEELAYAYRLIGAYIDEFTKQNMEHYPKEVIQKPEVEINPKNSHGHFEPIPLLEAA